MQRLIRRPDPVQLLIVVVIVDVALGAVLRADHAVDVLSGRADWHAWVGFFAALHLFLIVYALHLVTRRNVTLEGAIQRRDQRLEASAETSSDWLWETTPDLVLVYSSRRVEDVLGYTPREVVGRDVHDFMTPATARFSREALRAGAFRDGWRDVYNDWRHAQGHFVTVRHSGAPVCDPDGRLLGYRGTASVQRQDQREDERRVKDRQRVEELLQEGGITIALQPIIDIPTGHLVGVEAMARFPDGRRPDVWFEEARQVGLRADLEILAVRAALDRVVELPDGVTMSCNAGPDVIIDPRFVAMLLELGTALSRIVIEVTEHSRIEDYEALQRTLATLRAAGAGLAVDDTGAGYASLAHVLQLRPDIIKLDRSLVTGVQDDQARRTLITSLTLLALDIGAVVTAEGVETAAELEAVAALGVDRAQGYLIARPAVHLDEWPPGLLGPGDHSPASPRTPGDAVP